MNRFLAPAVLATALVITGCGGEEEAAEPATSETAPATAAAPIPSTASTTPEAAPETTSAADPEAPADLTGTWTQVNRKSEDSYQQATITADTIAVDWVTDGGATTSIYWVGTVSAPGEVGSWTSTRDIAATESAMLASSDPTKNFTVEGDTISYKVSALGTTTTVELQRD